jgi:hypothetical protein
MNHIQCVRFRPCDNYSFPGRLGLIALKPDGLNLSFRLEIVITISDYPSGSSVIVAMISKSATPSLLLTIPDAIRRSRAPRGKQVAGHVDSAEQIRSLQAVKIERQGVAVVDNADRDVGLSVGQIHRLVGGQYLHLDLGVKAARPDL